MQQRVQQTVLEAGWQSDCQVQRRLSGHYAEWTNLVEEELEHLTGHPLRRRGARARVPRLVQVPLLAVKRKHVRESKTMATALKRLVHDMEYAAVEAADPSHRTESRERAVVECDRLLDQPDLPPELGFAVARAQQLLDCSLFVPRHDEGQCHAGATVAPGLAPGHGYDGGQNDGESTPPHSYHTSALTQPVTTAIPRRQ